MKFYPYQYTCTNTETGAVSVNIGYFKDLQTLHDKIVYWSRFKGWIYSLSGKDIEYNSNVTETVELTGFSIGWTGYHEHEHIKSELFCN